ncbi:MAG: glutamate--tRNA ligase [Thermoguttaceae bacterium]|nr:glutamate--tRNA ligase [Thermoguttaceae bacterium]
MTEIRTRFAPSPTGYLHIGGVRTALFCYLFAKQQGGRFILRIDDTDQTRNVRDALQPILDGLKWLGIDWDEGPVITGAADRESFGPHVPYYQSLRGDKYQEAVDKLLASGHAYRDYARAEEIQAERQAAQDAKRTFVYSRRFMAETEADRARFEAEGRAGVVRLKMPREGKLVIHDLVRGDVEFDWATEQDHVIQRADGSFIYHLANVVDDHDFGISHVIRAEEHLSNTPRQIFIIQSLGWELPAYAHLPFVAEPGSKTKLSKRKLDKYLKNPDFAKLVNHGKSIADRVGLATTADGFNPVIVDFYRQVGYIPEGIINYLSLLGWALDDKAEFFRMADMVKLFTLDKVNKAPASFDPAKLFAFQEKHFTTLPTEEKYRRAIRYLIAAGWLKALDGPFARVSDFTALPDLFDPETSLALTRHEEIPPQEVKALITALIEAVGERIKVSGDILDFVEFLDSDTDFAIDEKAWAKRITGAPESAALLDEYAGRLAACPEENFTAPALEAHFAAFLEEKQIKPAQLIHALRVAVTGKGVGIGMFEALALLGKGRTLKRLAARDRKPGESA